MCHEVWHVNYLSPRSWIIHVSLGRHKTYQTTRLTSYLLNKLLCELFARNVEFGFCVVTFLNEILETILYHVLGLYGIYKSFLNFSRNKWHNHDNVSCLY